VGNVITLLPDTYYVICGLVNIGPNRIEVPQSSVLAGKDPLVDTLTADPLPNRDLVTFPLGGTIRDLALVWPVRGAAVVFGGVGSDDPPPPAQECVAWNLSISGAREAIRFQGQIGLATVSRVTASFCDRTIYQQPGAFIGESAILALYANMIASQANPAGARQLLLQGVAEAVAASAMVVSNSDPSAIGIEISGQAQSLQFWGCAFGGGGTPSQILDPITGGFETTGTATQSEAVGMVGYDNSTTRGSISLFGGLPQPNPGAGTYAPIGQGVAGYPLFALSASSVRCAIAGGPTTDLQTLQYIGARPYVADIAVSVTLATATGFITPSRTVGVRLLKNGAVLPGATWEGGLAPGAIAVTSAAVAFSVPDTLSGGDELQLEIANLTDGAQLIVTGAQIVIS